MPVNARVESALSHVAIAQKDRAAVKRSGGMPEKLRMHRDRATRPKAWWLGNLSPRQGSALLHLALTSNRGAGSNPASDTGQHWQLSWAHDAA